MRIVLMTANFAPRGGSHPTRTVHLTKYLRRLGHEVTVITYAESQHALYAEPDQSLAAKVPEDVEVRRIPPGWVHRFMGRAKRAGRQTVEVKRQASRNPLAALLVPDPHCSARRAFVQAGHAVIRDRHPEVLVTCAYPFTMTLVGAELRRRHPELVWIADYGDPWTGAPVAELQLPGWRRALDARLEARALAAADAVTMTTGPTAQLYRDLFPALADRVHVINMGFDPEDGATVAAAPRSAADADRVVLLHAGRLYSEARDPLPFIDAMDTCLAADGEATRRLKIVLLGDVEPSIREAMERSAAGCLYEFPGWVTVEESLARMKAADQLLLFGNAGAMQIPGKVYQYIGTGRPVFMTCADAADPTVDVLRQYDHGVVVPNRRDELVAALQAVLAGTNTTHPDAEACHQFSWPHLAERLAAIAAAARRPDAAEATS